MSLVIFFQIVVFVCELLVLLPNQPMLPLFQTHDGQLWTVPNDQQSSLAVIIRSLEFYSLP